jgi:hypothetical protein
MRNESKILDQYFTKPAVALACVQKLEDNLLTTLSTFEIILEPSYGEGAFVDVLKQKGIQDNNLVYIDIDSKIPKHKNDFLSNNL